MHVLATIQTEGPVGITRLASAVNLTHARMQDQLSEFENSGLVVKTTDGDRPAWRLTERGNLALQELHRIDRAMSDFGLDL